MHFITTNTTITLTHLLTLFLFVCKINARPVSPPRSPFEFNWTNLGLPDQPNPSHHENYSHHENLNIYDRREYLHDLVNNDSVNTEGSSSGATDSDPGERTKMGRIRTAYYQMSEEERRQYNRESVRKSRNKKKAAGLDPNSPVPAFLKGKKWGVYDAGDGQKPVLMIRDRISKRESYERAQWKKQLLITEEMTNLTTRQKEEMKSMNVEQLLGLYHELHKAKLDGQNQVPQAEPDNNQQQRLTVHPSSLHQEEYHDFLGVGSHQGQTHEYNPVFTGQDTNYNNPSVGAEVYPGYPYQGHPYQGDLYQGVSHPGYPVGYYDPSYASQYQGQAPYFDPSDPSSSSNQGHNG